MNRIPVSGYELPDRYQKDILEALVRDAHSIYVYWEVSDRKRWLVSQHFRCEWGVMPKILRVYDVTCVFFNGSNANSFVDIRTTPEATNWYIHHLNANATYLIDFGTYTIEGQFVPLMRSRAIVTPRNYPAVMGEPLVSVVPEVYDGKNVRQRIMPRFHENFRIYEEFAK